MVLSNSTDPPDKLKMSHEDLTLSFKLNQLKKKIQGERVASIKEKLEKNGEKLLGHISKVVLPTVTKAVPCMEDHKLDGMLSSRIQNPLCKFTGFSQGLGEKDFVNGQEVILSMSTKLPNIENIPPYTTWIFLDRNQRMAEDQSVVGRRRIYYDKRGSEALICSDSEEEIPEPEEEKHFFCEGEDRIIWMTFQEHGSNEEVLNLVSQFIGRTTLEIQRRYDMLQDKHKEKHDQIVSVGIKTEKNILLDKSLSAALDSIDNIFCRRCLVFDCRLHGCSQNLIYPSEKQRSLAEVGVDGKPCSEQCYLLLLVHKKKLKGSVISASNVIGSSTLKQKDGTSVSSSLIEKNEDKNMDIVLDRGCLTENFIRAASVTACSSEVNVEVSDSEISRHANSGKRKISEQINTKLQESPSMSEVIQDSLINKKQKQLLASVVVPVSSEVIPVLKRDTCIENQTANDSGSVSCEKMGGNGDDEAKDVGQVPGKNHLAHSVEQEVQRTTSSKWIPIEKDLYLKGVEIFGKNSCLIARNLLSGMKTCIEVFNYMYDGGPSVPRRSSLVPNSYLEADGKTCPDDMEQDMPTRSRLFRRRGRTRKLKYSWKSAGHSSIWKRIADGKNQSCKQYTPCGCQSMCGKQCPCLHNGTCCEKYCGCSKSCKNRFRGCHCAKSQCRSRQCPCFAAGRECDPDVCRNCWVSCGDYSLGEPRRKGDSQCGNMRLLLRQQQKILLGKSDIAGWGAFIKNSVNKNDYLGEYTGELISHKEADKRGKIYDRANSSFLFDLNDQYVLDAYRKGDKLKFANHSANPNCYAKVMLVAGDHRVGIFAKEHIEASEELFYDYRYVPDQAPAWARRPEGSKREESTSYGRPKKHQSH